LGLAARCEAGRTRLLSRFGATFLHWLLDILGPWPDAESERRARDSGARLTLLIEARRTRPYVAPFMLNEDSFQYAVENTRVILAPERRIETFGTTSFHFYLITELMDRVNEVRVRDGQLHAERPQIITPGHLSHLLLDGFGEKARDFADWMEHHGEAFTMLKYGFQIRKTEVVEKIVQSSVDDAIDRVRNSVAEADQELSAIIHGVDDAWEVCLLKFTVDLIQKSAGGNLGDFRGRGLL
jgi:hypothetical protein